MANYRVGEIIRLARQTSGMSQEELCENICSVETLSRIENGKHRVKKETYRQLMERMGRITEKTYAVCVSKDMELIEERAYYEDAMAKHDYEKAAFYMKLIKKKAGNSKLTSQYVRRESAFLEFYQKKISAEELVDILEELTQEVIPGYEKYLDSEKIYPFMEQELTLLKRLAVAYRHKKEHLKSIKICEMILRTLEKEYMIEADKMRLSISCNLAIYYGETGEHRKAIELEKEIMEIAKKSDDGAGYIFYFFELAWDMIKEIEKGKLEKTYLEECKKYLKRAYYLASSRNNVTDSKIISDFYGNYFQESIEPKL